MQSTRVIINADDLGYSEQVNDCIVELMQARRISSATIMANGPAVEDAATKVRHLSHCSIGVHLNATEFEPLSPPSIRPALGPYLDESGSFKGDGAFRRVRAGASQREALFNEWRLQVEKVQRLGIRVSHFDSHHHVHTLPWVFPVLKRLQRHFGIRKVRNTWNVHSGRIPLDLALRKTLWAWALRHAYATVVTKRFTTLATFATVARQEALWYESVEVMVHPGQPDFSRETRLLIDDWDALFQPPLRVIRYDQL